ncbi:cyclodeaminase [Marinococcus sp. PL1-022]|uniref:cyclodeaminase n=1 Tax=Marinococcus sp. PL1-022 TaxID=3095363 RepID=UPI0029C2D53B|nr:cyclodeaminase [Marinococcus sp. PL1-022]MDX6154142.1 cyclodeaminase [Marinococcus sp. PL1-022]
MYLFKEKSIRNTIDVNQQALSLIEDGFRRLQAGEVTMPPVLSMPIADKNGEMDAKTAYVKGMDQFALKISTGFFDNPDKGLPSLSGMMLLFHSDTGFPAAVLQDNGYLTDVRTGIAGAVAARYLAKDEAKIAGIVGTGTQARFQLRALKMVRPSIEKVYVYGRKKERIEAYQREMEHELGVTTEAADLETVVRNCDVLVTTTPATEPFIKKEWLHPGLHITAMGSDASEKNEIEPDVLGAVDILACDASSQVFSIGEHRTAKEAGIIDESSTVELGAIISGEASRRETMEQITLCDLTGTGVQDTAIAVYTYDQLKVSGEGLEITEDE